MGDAAEAKSFRCQPTFASMARGYGRRPRWQTKCRLLRASRADGGTAELHRLGLCASDDALTVRRHPMRRTRCHPTRREAGRSATSFNIEAKEVGALPIRCPRPATGRHQLRVSEGAENVVQ